MTDIQGKPTTLSLIGSSKLAKVWLSIIIATDVEGLINLDSANFDKNLWSVHLHDQCPATSPTWSQAGVVQDTEYVNLCGPEG